MGFFKNLKKSIQDKIDIQDQSVSMERLPTESKGLRSLLGGRTRKKELMPVSMPAAPPAPTGIEALIRPQRTDPGNQEDMRKLMEMQRQTFRSFLAPPAPPPPAAFPVTGADLGLPIGPGTPAPPGVIFESPTTTSPGVIFEPEIGEIDIQEILDNLPKGVGVGGIGSVPVPDIPYEIPQITVPADLPKLPVDLPIDLPIQVPLVEDFIMPSLPVELPLQLPQIENIGIPAIQIPFEIPSLPQVAMMPNVSPVAMPAMKMARATPSIAGMRER